MTDASTDTGSTELRIGPQGRIVIPASLRRALGLAPGDRLVVRAEGGALVLERPDAALRRLQARFDGVRDGVSLAEELIAERRAEAAREREP
ncbi:MAG: AbrB/MazE/SpoVT family DNA-binding domain-containing protein [Pseudomonadales bacterium]|jgi:AbrB family looped-hinge helix DNA binding protein|nr:AbrB/MazE/SpoVT family DNA-binding domain-containing protein [Pseudomonadales bacterium]